MRFPRLHPCLPASMLLLLAAGCGGPFDATQTDPEEASAPEADLTFLRFTQDAPPLADTVVSFWARADRNREIEIRYLPRGDFRGGTCLYFRVPGNSLLRHPYGRAVQPNDSVLITIRVVRATHLHFQFLPAGLQFDPERPAELRVFYDWVDRDYNGDGRVDEADEAIHQRFGFWRQEQAGENWVSRRTDRDDNTKRARLFVSGFTSYALASN
jgi:hypothetical protein